MKHRFHKALSLSVALFSASFLSLAFTSCNETFTETENTGKEAFYMATSVQLTQTTRANAAGTSTINSGDPENAVKSIRLIIFDSPTGNVLHNVKHDVAHFTNQPAGTSSVWHDPFKLTPGQRDFFFIANEDSWNGLSAALAGVTNRSQLYTNTAFTQLAYDPDYKPTEKRPIVMTQAYFGKNIQQTRNGKGTQADPQHFEAEGDEEVDLIRTLAKVRLTVKKIAKVEEVGGEFKASKLQFRNFNNFKSLKLIQVPKYFSLFSNPYFKSETYAQGKKTTAEFYNNPSPGTETKVIEADARVAVNANENKYQAATIAELSDYTTTLYVPEFIRPLGPTVDEVPYRNLSASAMTFGFYSDADNLVYKTSVDHGAGQATFQWEATAQPTSNTTKFVLPNAATTYSRYTVVRNNFYDIVAEEVYPELRLKYTVLPWEDCYRHAYLGSYFNVYVEDPEFPTATSKVRIITSEPSGVPADFSVTVKRSGSDDKITHTNTQHQSYTEKTFNLGGVPATGANVLEIYYKDELVKILKKP